MRPPLSKQASDSGVGKGEGVPVGLGTGLGLSVGVGEMVGEGAGLEVLVVVAVAVGFEVAKDWSDAQAFAVSKIVSVPSTNQDRFKVSPIAVSG